jgi:hypothetical protein
LDLAIKITTDTCDAASLVQGDDHSYKLFESGEFTYTKLWAEDPYLTLCGTLDYTYETLFTSIDSVSTLISGLPSFITLNTDTENVDTLQVDAQNTSNLGTYDISIYKTKIYLSSVEVSESFEA